MITTFSANARMADRAVRSWPLWVLAATIGLVLAPAHILAKPATGVQQAGQPKPAQVNRGTLRLFEESFDFGYVAQNTKVSHSFILRNTGEDTLFIQRVAPGCGCTSAPLTKNVLPPGDRVPLEVTFSSGKMSGHVRKTVTIHSSDGKVPMTSLEFSATVAALPTAVGIEPAAGIDLNKFASTASPEGKVALTNLSTTGGTLKIVGAAPSFLEARVSTARLEPRQAADIIVKAKADAPVGRFAGSVTVMFEGGPGTRLSIPVVGESTSP